MRMRIANFPWEWEKLPGVGDNKNMTLYDWLFSQNAAEGSQFSIYWVLHWTTLVLIRWTRAGRSSRNDV